MFVTLAEKEAVKRRLGRVDLKALSGLDDYKGADKKSLGLGRQITDLIEKGKRGELDAEQLNRQVNEVARRAVSAMDDTAESRDMLGDIQGTLAKAGFGMGAANFEGMGSVLDLKMRLPV